MKNKHHSFVEHLSDEELRQAFFKRFQVKTGELIIGSEQAAQHLTGLIVNRDREKFAVIYLDGANALINSEVIFEGSLTIAAIYPREIIKRVIDNSAAAIIIGHNHPSGLISPSEGDIKVTQAIRQACGTMEIIFHDHIIIGKGRWFSFQDSGML